MIALRNREPGRWRIGSSKLRTFGIGALVLLASCDPAPSCAPSPSEPAARSASGADSAANPPATAAGRFAATFDSADDFYGRFNLYAGNFINETERTDQAGRYPWIETPALVHGDHDMSCGGPTSARDLAVSNPDWKQYFWWCAPGNDASKGHIMTGFDTTGYAILGFSPNEAFTNVSQICWDVNATEEGGGKWTNMLVIPDSLYQRFAPRLDYVTAGFNEPDAPGDFNVQARDHPGEEVWGIKDFRGTQELFVGDARVFYSGDTSYTSTDKAARYQHCVRNTGPNTSVLTVQRAGGATTSYNLPRAIPVGSVRVIFQDDMYDPPKRERYSAANVTWHWDNIVVDHG